MVTEPARQSILRVLLVDDEACARRAVRAFLETWPGVVGGGEAANGAEAVDRVAGCRPDVVVLDYSMDYSMPVMDGAEATRRIKAARPGTAVVLVTIYASAGPEARAARADAFLLEGFTGDELMGTLRAVVPAS